MYILYQYNMRNAFVHTMFVAMVFKAIGRPPLSKEEYLFS